MTQLRLEHLVVDRLEGGGQLVGHRADDEKEVGLARREARQPRAEAVDVEMGAGRGHVLHAAARRDEGVMEERELAGPAEGGVETRGQDIEPAHDQSKMPFFQA